MNFFSPVVALYLYKSTIWSSMEYCCYFWTGSCSCYLEMLHKLPKLICRTFGPSFVASFEPLAHRQNVASLCLLCRYYFGRYSCQLAHLAQRPYYQWRSTGYSDGLHYFSVTIFRLYKDIYMNNCFPYAAGLELSDHRMLSFSYDLNGFKFRGNRHLLLLGSF